MNKKISAIGMIFLLIGVLFSFPVVAPPPRDPVLESTVTKPQDSSVTTTLSEEPVKVDEVPKDDPKKQAEWFQKNAEHFDPQKTEHRDALRKSFELRSEQTSEASVPSFDLVANEAQRNAVLQLLSHAEQVASEDAGLAEHFVGAFLEQARKDIADRTEIQSVNLQTAVEAGRIGFRTEVSENGEVQILLIGRDAEHNLGTIAAIRNLLSISASSQGDISLGTALGTLLARSPIVKVEGDTLITESGQSFSLETQEAVVSVLRADLDSNQLTPEQRATLVAELLQQEAGEPSEQIIVIENSRVRCATSTCYLKSGSAAVALLSRGSLQEDGSLSRIRGGFASGKTDAGTFLIAGAAEFHTHMDGLLDLTKSVTLFKEAGKGSFASVNDGIYGQVDVATGREQRPVKACFECTDFNPATQGNQYAGYVVTKRVEGNDCTLDGCSTVPRSVVRGFIATRFGGDAFHEGLHKDMEAVYYPDLTRNRATPTAVFEIKCEGCEQGDVGIQTLNNELFRIAVEPHTVNENALQLRYKQIVGAASAIKAIHFAKFNSAGITFSDKDVYADPDASFNHDSLNTGVYNTGSLISNSIGRKTITQYIREAGFEPSTLSKEYTGSIDASRDLFVLDSTAFNFDNTGKRVPVENLYVAPKAGGALVEQLAVVETVYKSFFLGRAEGDIIAALKSNPNYANLDGEQRTELLNYLWSLKSNELYFKERLAEASALVNLEADKAIRLGVHDKEQAHRLIATYDQRSKGAEQIFEQQASGKTLQEIFASVSSPEIKEAFRDPFLARHYNAEAILLKSAEIANLHPEKRVAQRNAQIEILNPITGRLELVSFSDATRIAAERTITAYLQEGENYFHNPKEAVKVWGHYVRDQIPESDRAAFDSFMDEMISGASFLGFSTNDAIGSVRMNVPLDSELHASNHPPTYFYELAAGKNKGMLLIAPPEMQDLIQRGVIPIDQLDRLLELNDVFHSDKNYQTRLELVEAFIPQSAAEVVFDIAVNLVPAAPYLAASAAAVAVAYKGKGLLRAAVDGARFLGDFSSTLLVGGNFGLSNAVNPQLARALVPVDIPRSTGAAVPNYGADYYIRLQENIDAAPSLRQLMAQFDNGLLVDSPHSAGRYNFYSKADMQYLADASQAGSIPKEYLPEYLQSRNVLTDMLDKNFEEPITDLSEVSSLKDLRFWVWNNDDLGTVDDKFRIVRSIDSYAETQLDNPQLFEIANDVYLHHFTTQVSSDFAQTLDGIVISSSDLIRTPHRFRPAPVMQQSYTNVDHFGPLPEHIGFNEVYGLGPINRFERTIVMNRETDPVFDGFLIDYATEVSGVGNHDQLVEAAVGATVRAINRPLDNVFVDTGQIAVPIGYFISTCTGVCRNRAPLVKAALDEVGVKSKLMIGWLGDQRHMWTEVHMDDGRVLVADPMLNKIVDRDLAPEYVPDPVGIPYTSTLPPGEASQVPIDRSLFSKANAESKALQQPAGFTGTTTSFKDAKTPSDLAYINSRSPAPSNSKASNAKLMLDVLEGKKQVSDVPIERGMRLGVGNVKLGRASSLDEVEQILRQMEDASVSSTTTAKNRIDFVKAADDVGKIRDGKRVAVSSLPDIVQPHVRRINRQNALPGAVIDFDDAPVQAQAIQVQIDTVDAAQAPVFVQTALLDDATIAVSSLQEATSAAKASGAIAPETADTIDDALRLYFVDPEGFGTAQRSILADAVRSGTYSREHGMQSVLDYVQVQLADEGMHLSPLEPTVMRALEEGIQTGELLPPISIGAVTEIPTEFGHIPGTIIDDVISSRPAPGVYFRGADEANMPTRFGIQATTIDQFIAMQDLYALNPAFVRPYDVVLDSSGDVKGIRMAFVDGIDLHDYVQRGGEVTAELKQEIADTFTEIWKSGRAHGDINDFNIRFNPDDGSFKVIDPFGYGADVDIGRAIDLDQEQLLRMFDELDFLQEINGIPASPNPSFGRVTGSRENKDALDDLATHLPGLEISFANDLNPVTFTSSYFDPSQYADTQKAFVGLKRQALAEGESIPRSFEDYLVSNDFEIPEGITVSSLSPTGLERHGIAWDPTTQLFRAPDGTQFDTSLWSAGTFTDTDQPAIYRSVTYHADKWMGDTGTNSFEEYVDLAESTLFEVLELQAAGKVDEALIVTTTPTGDGLKYAFNDGRFIYLEDSTNKILTFGFDPKYIPIGESERLSVEQAWSVFTYLRENPKVQPNEQSLSALKSQINHAFNDPSQGDLDFLESSLESLVIDSIDPASDIKLIRDLNMRISFKEAGYYPSTLLDLQRRADLEGATIPDTVHSTVLRGRFKPPFDLTVSLESSSGLSRQGYEWDPSKHLFRAPDGSQVDVSLWNKGNSFDRDGLPGQYRTILHHSEKWMDSVGASSIEEYVSLSEVARAEVLQARADGTLNEIMRKVTPSRDTGIGYRFKDGRFVILANEDNRILTFGSD